MTDVSGSLYTVPNTSFVKLATKVPENATIYNPISFTTGSTVHTYYRGVSGSAYVYSVDTPPAGATNVVILGTRTS